MKLQDLIDLSAQVYPFDTSTYPEIGSYTEEEKTAFAISHQALHFAKTTGKIAGLAEEIDHATTGFTETRRIMLEEQLAAQFVNVLRLAETLEINGDALLELAANRMGAMTK